MADLQQDAHAVAGLPLGILTRPVLQMLHDLQRVIQRFMALSSFDVNDRANAAVVMLKPGIIQSGRIGAFGKIVHRIHSSASDA